MRLVRIAALGILLVVGGASVSAAQDRGGGGQGRGAGMLLRGITLDEATRVKVDSIIAKYRAEMPPMTPGQPPDSATRAKRMEVMGKQAEDIKKLLKPEDQKIIDQNLETMRAGRGGRPGQ
jgi:Spy/CpxP family protein refolding chaperone